jgi:hypothetical protein
MRFDGRNTGDGTPASTQSLMLEVGVTFAQVRVRVNTEPRAAVTSACSLPALQARDHFHVRGCCGGKPPSQKLRRAGAVQGEAVDCGSLLRRNGMGLRFAFSTTARSSFALSALPTWLDSNLGLIPLRGIQPRLWYGGLSALGESADPTVEPNMLRGVFSPW